MIFKEKESKLNECSPTVTTIRGRILSKFFVSLLKLRLLLENGVEGAYYQTFYGKC